MKVMSIKNGIQCCFLFLLIKVGGQNVLSSQEAVELALEFNHGIKIAKNNVEIADNNANILNSEFLPRVTGSAGATFNKDNTDAQNFLMATQHL